MTTLTPTRRSSHNSDRRNDVRSHELVRATAVVLALASAVALVIADSATRVAFARSTAFLLGMIGHESNVNVDFAQPVVAFGRQGQWYAFEVSLNDSLVFTVVPIIVFTGVLIAVHPLGRWGYLRIGATCVVAMAFFEQLRLVVVAALLPLGSGVFNLTQNGIAPIVAVLLLAAALSWLAMESLRRIPGVLLSSSSDTQALAVTDLAHE
jgi:hypothetical protein